MGSGTGAVVSDDIHEERAGELERACRRHAHGGIILFLARFLPKASRAKKKKTMVGDRDALARAGARARRDTTPGIVGWPREVLSERVRARDLALDDSRRG